MRDLKTGKTMGLVSLKVGLGLWHGPVPSVAGVMWASSALHLLPSRLELFQLRALIPDPSRAVCWKSLANALTTALAVCTAPRGTSSPKSRSTDRSLHVMARPSSEACDLGRPDDGACRA